MRRIGVLMNQAADDLEGQARLAAFLQGLQILGWADGRNAQIDSRWSTGSATNTRKYAAELVALSPDVILTSGAAAVATLLQVTRSCQSCSGLSPIRSAPALSIAWRGRAATPQDSPHLNTALAANGWNYLKRLRRA